MAIEDSSDKVVCVQVTEWEYACLFKNTDGTFTMSVGESVRSFSDVRMTKEQLRSFVDSAINHLREPNE